MPTYYHPMMSADARETIINAVLDDPRTDSLFKGNALGGFVRDVVEIAAIRARKNGVQLDHAAILWHLEQGVQSIRHEKDYAALIYAAKAEEEKASCE